MDLESPPSKLSLIWMLTGLERPLSKLTEIKMLKPRQYIAAINSEQACEKNKALALLNYAPQTKAALATHPFIKQESQVHSTNMCDTLLLIILNKLVK